MRLDKLEKANLVFNSKMAGVVFIIILLIGMLMGVEPMGLFLYSLILASFVFVFNFLNDYIGLRRHKSIIESKLFSELIDYGFEIENNSSYHGLIGQYKNAMVRIYYDWDKSAKGPFSFGDIVLNVFYQPILLLDSDLVDEERLMELNRANFGRFEIGTVRSFTLFSVGYMIHQINYYSKLRIESVLNELDACLEQIKLNNLKLIQVGQLEVYQRNFNQVYSPPIETYGAE